MQGEFPPIELKRVETRATKRMIDAGVEQLNELLEAGVWSAYLVERVF
jgi:hypothetical protein